MKKQIQNWVKYINNNNNNSNISDQGKKRELNFHTNKLKISIEYTPKG